MATPPAVDPDHGPPATREFPRRGHTDDAQADDDDIRALRVRHGTHCRSKGRVSSRCSGKWRSPEYEAIPLFVA